MNAPILLLALALSSQSQTANPGDFAWGDYDADVEFHYFANGVRRGFSDFESIADNNVFVPTVRDVPYGLNMSAETREMMVSSGLLNEDLTPNEAVIEAMGRTLQGLGPRAPGYP